MPCKACVHPNRAEVDRKIIAGVPLRSISASTGLSLGGLVRHKQCIKQSLGEAMRREQGEREGHGSDLLGRVHKLADESIGILETAKASGNLKAATSAICAAVRVLELTGRLDGSLAQPNAPGLHFTINQRVIHVSVNSYDNDVDFAMLVSEATNNFDPTTIAKLKALVDSSSVQSAHNRPAILLNPQP